MAYLEHGTGQSRGGWIYPRVKKALFVPLTKKAAFFNRARAVWGESEGVRGESGASFTHRTPKGRSVTKRLTYGTDYVLAKRVRGIRPRRIAWKEQGVTDIFLRREIESEARKIMAG